MSRCVQSVMVCPPCFMVCSEYRGLSALFSGVSKVPRCVLLVFGCVQNDICSVQVIVMCPPCFLVCPECRGLSAFFGGVSLDFVVCLECCGVPALFSCVSRMSQCARVFFLVRSECFIVCLPCLVVCPEYCVVSVLFPFVSTVFSGMSRVLRCVRLVSGVSEVLRCFRLVFWCIKNVVVCPPCFLVCLECRCVSDLFSGVSRVSRFGRFFLAVCPP